MTTTPRATITNRAAAFIPPTTPTTIPTEDVDIIGAGTGVEVGFEVGVEVGLVLIVGVEVGRLPAEVVTG